MQRSSSLPMIVLSALVAVLTVVLTTGSARAQTSSPLVQWGDSSNGQTNNAPPATERFIAISAGQSHSLALRADGSLVQWGATNLGQANNAPPASERFIAIAASTGHNLALKSVLPANVSFTYQGRLTGQSGPVDLQCVLYN